jgi:alkylation response protein AidB-like acyl-CoA dehydrogenase
VFDAEKSWVTSALHATAYVWSSRPAGAEGASTLWLVPANAPGLAAPRPYDGLGLRGNDSRPVTANGVKVAESQRLGADGEGFAIMMGTVLPYFNLMIAGFSVGLMEAATARTAAHASASRTLT